MALQDKLNFFEKRPLFGRKIVVPYIEEDSALHGENRIISKLEELGADVLAVKVGEIEPVIIEEFEKKISSMDWILFTSKNGVKAFFFQSEVCKNGCKKACRM